MYSWFSTPFSPSFGTGSTNPGLKGPSFSPGFALGTKSRLVIPTGAKEASRPGHVGRPFSPDWYYQPGLKVFFFFLFLFLFSIDDSFWFSNRFSNTHSTLLIIYVFYTLIYIYIHTQYVGADGVGGARGGRCWGSSRGRAPPARTCRGGARGSEVTGAARLKTLWLKEKVIRRDQNESSIENRNKKKKKKKTFSPGS